jgi:DNA-binding transcriptional LysR family regulator
LHHISIFVAVADTGGFARAARKTGVSPSVVTRAVNELETSLGVRLLIRTTRVVRLTEDGTRYAEDCRKILASLAEADDTAVGTHGEPRGHITVTSPAWFGSLYMTPIVTEYLTRFEGMKATCFFNDRLVNLIEEGVDVGLRIGELEDSSMQAIRVGSMRVVVCGSPEYLQKHGTPLRPEDLVGHSTVSASPIIPGQDWRFGLNGKPSTMRMHPRLSTTTNESAVASAINGFGLTQQMFYKVSDPIADGRLQIILADYEPEPLPVNLLHREGRNPSRRVRAFLDLAIDTLRRNPVLH